MVYQEFMRSRGIKVGDVVELSTDLGIIRGVVMPKHEYSADDVLVIKLQNGYNVGVAVNRIKDVRFLSSLNISEPEVAEITASEDLPTVRIVSTGGTIASRVEYDTGGVRPATTAAEVLDAVPEAGEICNLEVDLLFSILSESIRPDHWVEMAKACARALNGGVIGVVVAHGTDTMAYSSAALSFMLKDLNGPVVFVGSQRSADRPSSDARLNLIGALNIAARADVGEVLVAMHRTPSDREIALHRGTRVRKMHSTRRDAFRSIETEPMAIYSDGNITIAPACRPRSEGPVVVRTSLERSVGLVYIHPNLTPEDLSAIADGKRGLVLVGTGLGHIPADLVETIRDLTHSGCTVGITSQCIYGPVNLNVYHTGRMLLKAGVIPLDMLPEVALVKTMWVLGQTHEEEEIRALLTRDIAGEMVMRRRLSPELGMPA